MGGGALGPGVVSKWANFLQVKPLMAAEWLRSRLSSAHCACAVRLFPFNPRPSEAGVNITP